MTEKLATQPSSKIIKRFFTYNKSAFTFYEVKVSMRFNNNSYFFLDSRLAIYIVFAIFLKLRLNAFGDS